MARRLTVVALLCCGFLLPAAAGAQSGKGPYMGQFSVGAGLGYAVPNTDEYGNTLAYQFSIGYSPIPPVEIALEVGRFTSDVDQPEEDGVPLHTVASGELRVTPIVLGVRLRHAVPEVFSVLYGTIGVGYYLVDYRWSDAAEDYFARAMQSNPGRPAPEQDVDNGWGFHLGAGGEYLLTDALSVGLEVRYLVLSPAASGRWYDPAGELQEFGGDLDLNTWLVTAGIKYQF